GIDFGDAAPRAGSGPVVDVERTYDWVKRKALSKVWGTVLNSTPLKLLDDPTLAIDFETVNPKTGLPQGRVSFPREELEGGGAYGVGFGFADRVSNRVALLEREVRPGVGNTKTQIAAARTCLGWIEDDRDQALAGAER